MWEWFTENSIWFLSVSAIGVTILIFIRNRFRDKIARLKPEEKNTSRNRSIKRSFLILIGILLSIMITAVVAIILSSEGANAIIDAERIQEWLLTDGIIIVSYIIVAYFIYRLVKLFLPRFVTAYVKAQGKARHSKSWFEKRSQTLSNMLTWGFGFIIGIILLFMILSKLGLDITPLLASAGVAGIAIGFGAQSLIKDFVSGTFILLEDQFNKGDVVSIAGVAGIVEEVNLRRTVLRDLDGILHTIPNGEITTASNYTRDWSRVKLDVPVAYGEDMDHVFAVINRVGKEMAEDKYFKTLIKTPPQVLRIQNFGDSGIDIRILGDVRPQTQWEVTGELRKRLKKAFDDEGIEIPWPHVKLYFGENQQGITTICKACSNPNLVGNKFCSHCGAKL
ncbi:MAG: mechanosensitive ion channel [Dehalococcoidia bacterium]|nr:MAG: mechanosensitive ion channel [Dehalococcoidia bacterium]